MDGQSLTIVVTAVAAAIVGLSKGGLPGVGMLAVPVMSLVVSPLLAAGLLLPIFVVSDWFGLYAYRREFSRRNLEILIPAGVVGVGLGWALARYVSEAWVTLFIGVIGLGFVVSQFIMRQGLQPRPADVPRGIFWGVLTGFTSFVSHSGAPPFQVYTLPQQLGKMEFAGTSTILFAVINAVKLIPYWSLGQMNWESIREVAYYSPIAIIATFLGRYLTQVIPARIFFLFVNISLAAVSVLLIREGWSKL